MGGPSRKDFTADVRTLLHVRELLATWLAGHERIDDDELQAVLTTIGRWVRRLRDQAGGREG
jgi:hypothetical protein